MKVKKQTPEYQDINLIKLMLDRENYEVARSQVEYKRLTNEAKTLLKVIGTIYRDDSITEISTDTLKQYFIHAFPNMDEKHKEIYERVIDSVNKADATQIDIVLRKMRENYAYEQIEDIYRQDGFDIDQIQEVVDSVKKTNVSTIDTQEWDWDDIGSTSTKLGNLKWNLNLFNEWLDPPDVRQLYVIGAAPNLGKTAMVVDIAVTIAMQLERDQQVLWLNNEEPIGKVIDRWIARCCGQPLDVVKQYPIRAREVYEQRMSFKDRIKYIDTRKMDFNSVIELIKSKEWGLIVVDMVDNLKMPSRTSREDVRVEGLYGLFRELAQNHGTTIMTSQAKGYHEDQKGEKHYKRFLDQEALHNSNIAKQGATENIITIGCDSPENPTRYVRIAKSKGPGTYKWCQARLEFDQFKYED